MGGDRASDSDMSLSHGESLARSPHGQAVSLAVLVLLERDAGSLATVKVLRSE